MGSPPRVLRLPHLVGRAREQLALRERLIAALGGESGLVLVSGAAGIGKTALTEVFCREAAAQQASVLIGHCYDLIETPPYGPWVELFGRYQQGDGPTLPDAFARRGTVGEVASQAALFQQVQDFFATLATTRPLVLLVEDLHWADPASLDLLRALARALPALPLLLLATYRADELTPAHPLTHLLPALVRESPVERLDLRPLRADDVAALVTERYHLTGESTARLTAYALKRSEGNPLFLGELLRTLEEEEILQRTSAGWTLGFLANVRVPPLLRQIIEGRAARLDGESRRLLAIAAVLGQDVPLHHWAAVASVTEDALSPVIEEATAARLGEATSDGLALRFVHALIREAIYEGMSPPRRGAVHRTAGEMLAAGRDPDADMVANHFLRAGDVRAAMWLTRAGERAEQANALVTAATRYEAALALMGGNDDHARDRAMVLFQLARARRYDAPRQCLAYLEEAERLVQVSEDGVLAASIQFSLGRILCFLTDLAAGVERLQAGADALDTFSPEQRRRMEIGGADAPSGRGTVIVWLAYAGRFTEAEAMGERYIAGMSAESATGIAGAAYADAYHGLGIVYAHRGRPAASRRAFERAFGLNIAAGNLMIAGTLLLTMLYDVIVPYDADDVAGRERVAREAEHAWARADELQRGLPARAATVPVLALDGHWRAVEELVIAARDITAPATMGFLGNVALAQGKRAFVQALIDEQLPSGPATPPGSILYQQALMIQRLAVELSLAVGDPVIARRWLEAHDDWLTWSGAVLGRSEGQVLWARYHRQTGDAAQAYAGAERALAHATTPRQPLALLAAHRLLGELDTDAGRFGDAAIHLEGALALADACAAPYERALALLALGELHAASGDAVAASRMADEALTLCTDLGAQPALARANALAARIAAAKVTPPAYPAGLSAREVEVLRLVAAGRTNRDIAAALFLSEHTVHVHMRNILAKTNTDNRTAAAAFARQYGLT